MLLRNTTFSHALRDQDIRYSYVIVIQVIACKIINVPFFSIILEVVSEKETMVVEITTFVEVANNVNKVGKGEGVVLIL